MKKVLLGILIIIPVIILGIVTLVSSITSTMAHIGVESIEIILNEEYRNDDFITIQLSDIANKVVSLNQYLQVKVLPTKATNQTIEWTLEDMQILDQEYEMSYNYYLENRENENNEIIEPAVMFVDENRNQISTSTTGKLVVNTYCSFTIRAMAENHQAQTFIKIVGYDVEKVSLSMKKDSINVGESIMLNTSFVPVDSIVTKMDWSSLNEEIATVDSNGIVTALKDGQVTIKCKAYKYTDLSLFVENSIIININKALTFYGDVIYLSSNTISLSGLGISEYDLLEGCTANNDILTLSSSSAKIHIGDKYVQIYKCNEDDIKINQASVIDVEKGYVVAVSQMKINLTASYLSTFVNNDVVPIWSSSDEKIATIDSNGVLTTISSGLVVITANNNGRIATIELNLQNKVTFMQLSTTDSSLSVGLARETVFASQKYVNVNNSNKKEFNRVSIKIKGEPNSTNVDEILAFYGTYNFEIIEGKDFASLDNINTNELVLNNNLEGKGKQKIKIKVSAKYPRYESFEDYTTSYVTINAIYGLTVSDYDELKKAASEQKSYAYLSNNLIMTTNNPQICSNLSEIAKVSSKNTLAICIDKDFVVPAELDSNKVVTYIYGNVYGNNHMISATRGQLVGNDELLSVVWSDVTISNIILRANDLGNDTEISTGDASELNGQNIIVRAYEHHEKFRIININIEYCILENARCSGIVEGADVAYTGCIIRNMSNVGLYSTNQISKIDGINYITHVNLTFTNMIFSNCLGTALDLDTSLFEIDDTNPTTYRYADTKEESDRYIMENIVAKDLNGSFNQKGFLDIYNWTSTEDVALVKTGDQKLDDLIKLASSSLIGTDPSFAEYRYRYKSVDYFHLGFMVESMYQDDMSYTFAYNETVWMDINLEDNRFNKYSVSEIQDETIGKILKQFGLSIYAYKNNADLKPSSTYVINDKLIDKLHS